METLFEETPFLVTYRPLASEVDLEPFVPTTKEQYVVLPHPSLDPIQEAERATKSANGRGTAVLVPGRRFDATGTRHGKGAGWYDRFLSAVPASWIRIGFCTTEQFSTESLIRESWDEPMDYLVVVPEQEPPRFYTTHARS